MIDDKIIDGFVKRLNSLRKPKEKKYEFADRCGIHPATLSSYLRGDKLPQTAELIKIADACGVSMEWLIRGEEAVQGGRSDGSRSPIIIDKPSIIEEDNLSDSEYLRIPLIEGQVTAGPDGGILLDEALDHYPFKKIWAEKRISRDPRHLASLVLVRTSGESMHPTISAGELIMVDCWPEERVRLRRNSIYLCRLPDDSIAVKRVLYIDDGRHRIIYFSDNPAFPAFDFEIPEGRELHQLILGRVRWAGREFD